MEEYIRKYCLLNYENKDRGTLAAEFAGRGAVTGLP